MTEQGDEAAYIKVDKGFEGRPAFDRAEIEDGDTTPGSDYTNHLRNALLKVFHVTKRKAGDDAEEGIVCEWESKGVGLKEGDGARDRVLGSFAGGDLEHCPREVDTDNGRNVGLLTEGEGEVTGSGGNVEAKALALCLTCSDARWPSSSSDACPG